VCIEVNRLAVTVYRMGIKGHNLIGAFPYKMDAKCRVSIPGDWRRELDKEELFLLQSSYENVPTLRVLTETEFGNILQQIEESGMTVAKKRIARGLVFEKCVKAKLNDQGKLSVPKNICDHPGIQASNGLVLVGRGDYVEIFNEENYEKVQEAQEKFVEDEMADLGIF